MMILKTVRIENFKCIEDSGTFAIENVTCLVGKNEAGKTALLQALHKLNPDVTEASDFDDMEFPRRKWPPPQKAAGPINVLTTEWELEDDDVAAVEEKLGDGCLKSNRVSITKGYDNVRHWMIDLDETKIVAHLQKNARLAAPETNKLRNTSAVADLIEALEGIESPTDRQSGLLATTKATFPEGSPVNAAANLLCDRLPTFVYFDEFYRLPGEVALTDFVTRQQQEQLEFEDRVFIALLALTGTAPNEIDSISTFERLRASLEVVSNRLTAEIFEYWSQNAYLDVDFHFDAARPEDDPPFNTGFIFRTRIRNNRHRVTVSFDERSSGFVWFFSFLVWFSRLQENYGDNLIVLLDEPALSLHARAQADLLRYINERLKPRYQVMYTSHSPFLIDPENWSGVRTVEDTVRDGEILGTKVGEDLFTVEADTIFPLQAALGYDITQTLFVGEHTLLVEGPSDLLYLSWFTRKLKNEGRTGLDRRWVVCPVGGIDKVASFVALFGGNRLHVAVFADFHKGQKNKMRSLKESELLKKGHVFTADMYTEGDEADTEDLIGRPMYVALVNQCYGLDDDQKLLAEKPEDAGTRVIVEVQNHFATLTGDVPEFDHYTPASYLVENPAELRPKLPSLDDVLDRFEKLFDDLNALLPGPA